MKTFVGAMIAFLILISGIVVYGVYMEKNKQEFLYLLEETEKNVYKEDAESSQKYLSEIEKRWKDTKNLLMAFCDHQDLVAIEEHLKSIKSALIYSDFKEAHSEIVIFRIFLMYAFEGTTPSLTNIL